MKIDRLPTRVAAVLLAGLLLAVGQAAADQLITFHFGKKKGSVAVALARGVGEVQKRFDKSRRALRRGSVPGPGGAPVYSSQEVAGLIARTEKDLDQAIEQIGEPGLDALRAWAAEEIRRIREELAAQPDHTAALPVGLSTPRAVAVVATLETLPLSRLASVNSAASQGTISSEKLNRLLDQVGEVVGRIFALAKKDDLEVELWVGSTPAPQAEFRFWSQGQIKGATPAPQIIPTNGKKDHVLRGLYNYRASLGQGTVTELIAYPNPAGTSTAGLASERLDLVNGTSFFCCRFDQQSCQHVANKKECRP